MRTIDLLVIGGGSAGSQAGTVTKGVTADLGYGIGDRDAGDQSAVIKRGGTQSRHCVGDVVVLDCGRDHDFGSDICVSRNHADCSGGTFLGQDCEFKGVII